MPVELKVLGWKKGQRKRMVNKGAGGRVSWGAKVEHTYTTGYDVRGRVTVNRLVDERGCSALLETRHTTSAS